VLIYHLSNTRVANLNALLVVKPAQTFGYLVSVGDEKSFRHFEAALRDFLKSIFEFFVEKEKKGCINTLLQ
jgi:hypothetical protein